MHKLIFKFMVLLSSTDYFYVKINSMIADYDRETLINLYQPIIGYGAISIYFTLLVEAKLQKIKSASSHSELLLKLSMNTGDFLSSRKKLEAMGLLKTYLEKNKEINIYHYVINAPETPQKFFDNVLYYGLLIKSVGEKGAERIKLAYKVHPLDTTYYSDVSSTFGEEFNPDFNDSAFFLSLNNNDKLQSRQKGKIDSSFSYEIFFEELRKISQLTQNSLTKKQMKEIERLSTLYGISEDVASEAVSDLYHIELPKEQRIDFEQLQQRFNQESSFRFLKSRKTKTNNLSTTNIVSSKSDLASKINYFENKTPIEFLSLLQNGTEPASPDINLINRLSSKFNLSNPVINVLIDYVLQVNDNILSSSYCEKIAASLARENISTALDAMNYFKKITKQERKSKKSYNYGKKSSENNTFDENSTLLSDNNKEETAPQDDKIDEKEWDDMLKKLEENGNED